MKLASTFSLGARSAVVLLSIGSTAPLAAQRDVSRLALPAPAQIEGRTYVAEMTQSIDIEAQKERHNVERQSRIRFTFRDARAEAGERVAVSVAVDSLRAAANTPHGRQVVDTRRSIGTAFDLVYARHGGPATYPGSVPELDFGAMGGRLYVSTLIDLAMPALPDRPVRVGDSWERRWIRRQVVGKTVTERPVTSRSTLDRLETRNGVRLARVEVTTRGTAGDPFEATGHVLIGVSDGVVHEVLVTESMSGSWNFNGAELPLRQTTTLRLALTGDITRASRRP